MRPISNPPRTTIRALLWGSALLIASVFTELQAASTDVYISVTSTSSPGMPGQVYSQLTVNYTTTPLTRTTYPHLSLSNYLGKGTISYDGTGRGVSYISDPTQPSLHIYAKPKLIYIDPSWGIYLTSYKASASLIAAESNEYVGKGWLTHGANYVVSLTPDTTTPLTNIGLRVTQNVGNVGSWTRVLYSYNYYSTTGAIPSGWMNLGKGRISGPYVQNPLWITTTAPTWVTSTSFLQVFTPTKVGVPPYSIYSGNYQASSYPGSGGTQYLFGKSTTISLSGSTFLGSGYISGSGLTLSYSP